MSTCYRCLGDSYAESAVMNKTRVVNVFVIIWRHSYGLSYAALLIVHLIFFRCPRNKKHRCELCRKQTHLTIEFVLQMYLHLVYFCCASYNLTKWPVSASFQVSLCTSLSAVQCQAKERLRFLYVSQSFFPFTQIMNIHKYLMLYLKPIQSTAYLPRRWLPSLDIIVIQNKLTAARRSCGRGGARQTTQCIKLCLGCTVARFLVLNDNGPVQFT